MRSVCVFCGSSSGHDAAFASAAASFGQLLASEGIELVWGGGNVGLMGVVADSVLSTGGRVYGVIPSFMEKRELAHPQATELVVVDSMHARKAAMAQRAEAFVALPGGYGTLDELFEIITWAQLHIHAKPVGLLNVRGFFDPLLAMVRHMSAEGFIKPPHLNLFHVAEQPVELLRSMRVHVAPQGDWLGEKLASDAR
ncbi:TIGR00730 family Rossman fold protein [Propionivibrio soli]|uniref:LOG family protein n=1 Tax=Propionivibrio soli TaxID=2976531 RepID=UPI0021E9879D|nr:TIGR00730 family Rossman fold protein [Propionivibrio soli]